MKDYPTGRVVLDVLLSDGEDVEEFSCPADRIIQPPRKRYRPGIIHEGKERTVLTEIFTPN